MIKCNGTSPTKPKADSSGKHDGDDVFLDSEGEETGDRKSRVPQANSRAGHTAPDHASNTTAEQMGTSAHRSEDSQRSGSSRKTNY